MRKKLTEKALGEDEKEDDISWSFKDLKHHQIRPISK
jgi:hypothetical protein